MMRANSFSAFQEGGAVGCALRAWAIIIMWAFACWVCDDAMDRGDGQSCVVHAPNFSASVVSDDFGASKSGLRVCHDSR